VNAFTKSVARLHFAEERKHADVAGAYFGYGAKEQNHQQECGNADSNEAQQTASSAAAVNNFPPSRIKDCHGSFSTLRF
jgi:hypothetical protein